MKYKRYDQEAAYQAGEIAQSVQHLCIRVDYIAGQIEKLVAIEQELLEMQKEMFEDYKKVRERAHVKLQGDYVSAHDPDHEE